jgi:hypothetical protein
VLESKERTLKNHTPQATSPAAAPRKARHA